MPLRSIRRALVVYEFGDIVEQFLGALRLCGVGDPTTERGSYEGSCRVL
jgi:hypothetical protein